MRRREFIALVGGVAIAQPLVVRAAGGVDLVVDGVPLPSDAKPDENRAMITINSQPIIEPDPNGGWQLILLIGETADYTTPFRSLLSDIIEMLNREVQSSLELPDYEKYEDFVEGRLVFGRKVLRVYYEHSLSYVALSSDDDETLRDVEARLRSIMNFV
jgi:hypothetical protein